jgi:hypothetical protein
MYANLPYRRTVANDDDTVTQTTVVNGFVFHITDIATGFTVGLTPAQAREVADALYEAAWLADLMYPAGQPLWCARLTASAAS